MTTFNYNYLFNIVSHIPRSGPVNSRENGRNRPLLSRIKKWISQSNAEEDPQLSVIVVAYNMQRELPRTLLSLSRDYQQNIENLSYEVIVADNGSSPPVQPVDVERFGQEFRVHTVNDSTPSPAGAINEAVAASRGSQLCIMIDGARVLSPGILSKATDAWVLSQNSVLAVLGFHLGQEQQRFSVPKGYTQSKEDQLLDNIDWPTDGYRLFEISCLAGSSASGWHKPLAESNCLFLSRSLFEALGGFNASFNSPGGGLVNLDFYSRLCERKDIALYHLLGEGSFHQVHGGITTGGANGESQRYDQLQAEYMNIRGNKHMPPQRKPRVLGQHVAFSAAHDPERTTKDAEVAELIKIRQDHMTRIGL